MTALSLKQFRATRKEVNDLADTAGYDSGDLMTNSAYVYEGDCYIERYETEGDFYLAIGCHEWISSDLAALEKILYEQWYLPEIAGVN